uniref:RNA-directed DNA polymerase n=1 Tax=Strongyloides papillosus TaxID=174720 RepID=A0A0N5B4A5_STREA
MLREELLRRFHSHPLIGQHFGFDKLADKFCLIFFWPKMLEDMKRIWQDCEVCWKVKHQPSNLAATNTKTIPKPEGIWETLNADYIQLEDHLHVLVIIDEYSRFVYTAVTKRQDQNTTLLQLMKCFSTFGFPKVLRTDGGSGFIGNKVLKYLKSFNVTHYVSLPHNHTSNAFAERFNCTIRKAIRAQPDLSYTDAVYTLTYAYNRTKHSLTDYPPCYFILNTTDKFSNKIAIYSFLCGLKDIKFGRTEFSELQPKKNRKILSAEMFMMKRVLYKKLHHTSYKN